MRIGIGITTNDRPELLKALVSSIHKHTTMSEVNLYIADDSIDKVGVAKKKNECLRALKGCEFVFLLDDDVEIIKDAWVYFFINAGHHHLLYLNDSHKPFIHAYGSTVYLDCGGVFMYMTKECIDKVGAFDEKYIGWGLEHADYSKRIAMAMGYQYPYKSLDNTNLYIHAHDYSNPNHVSSISNEEKQKYFDLNFPKFKEPIKNIYIPL